MPNILVSVYSWENPKLFSCETELKKGDKVIVSMENGNELGEVLGVDMGKSKSPTEKILRKATEHDKEAHKKHEKEKKEYFKICRRYVKELDLPMKVIDARISLDSKQAIFIFTADGRVDFRELVKNLSKEFKKVIRMQQIGSRDESRKLGGFGICGRELCCVKFSGNIPSITTDMARVQQISHRGTDRISGLCGRLMCCLAYEADQYKELLEGMPEIYSTIDIKEGRGTVMDVNVTTQEVKVKLESGKYIIMKKEDFK